MLRAEGSFLTPMWRLREGSLEGMMPDLRCEGKERERKKRVYFKKDEYSRGCPVRERPGS